MDLGHPLKFGVAINQPDPGAVDANELDQDGLTPADLALHAQEVGLDTVSFTAAQPELDPWIEAVWVAGKTSTLTVNVRALDPRVHVPAMTAHSAATLSILAPGRVGLSLHTGPVPEATTSSAELDFWTESLEVIRSMWDTSSREGVTFTGDFHRLAGAQPGPAPADTIPVSVRSDNAVVVGELADAWVTSLDADLSQGVGSQGFDADELAGQLRAIDAAAMKVGRDPREIVRRVQLNRSFLLGPDPARFLNTLVDLGFAEFEIMTGSSQDLTIFAMEVVPRLTKAVAASRLEANLVPGYVKHVSVRAHRSPAIDYAAIPPELWSRVVEPGEAKYGAVKSTYMRGGSPSLVIQPRTVPEVSSAVRYAQTQDVELGIRSGGHGFSGRSTNRGGIVIDVGGLNDIEVLDRANRIIRVGPGARWGQVAQVIEPYGWAISSGDFGGVGVGGLATAGGVGFFGRKHGLTIDHMVAAEIVLADGSLVRASATENLDLFWAIRGAGQNFGIVTAFEFQAQEVGDIGFAQLALQVDDLPQFLVDFGAAVEAAPRELTPFLLMGKPNPGSPIVAQIMAVVASPDPDEIVSALQPFANLGELVGQQVALTTYSRVVSAPDTGPSQALGEPVARSAAVNHITPALAKELASFILRGETYFFQIRSTGGAAGDVPVHETAYAHRKANFHLSALAANQGRINQAWDAMAEHYDGMYISFDTDRRPERIRDAYPPITLVKLQGLKKKYDPQNVFRDNFNIVA